MDEQSPNESQPKVRRAGSGGAEEPRPSAPRAGHTGQAEQEAPENASEKLLRAGESQVGSVPQGPFQATQHALEEWTHFFRRAVERNSRAAGDLRTCHSVASVLQWQRNLVQGNFEDWLQTSFAVFGVSVRKVPHAQAASKTAAI
jgi:hypothetical protein